jgi:hypothetical protein
VVGIAITPPWLLMKGQQRKGRLMKDMAEEGIDTAPIVPDRSGAVKR